MKDVAEHQERKSILGRAWELQMPVPDLQRELERKGLARQVASILSARGISSADLAGYLNPMIRESLPDPSRFVDMDRGVAHVADRIMSGGAISIWSDYDCDGVTSASVMKRFFRMIGWGEIDVRIPDRITEGYGPNAKGLRELRESGIETTLVLDSGIVAYQALDAAIEVGLDVVVIDHHEAAPEPMTEEQRDDPTFDRSILRPVPTAVAVINPNRHDETPGFGHLCAAGMCFIFCVGLARELKARGWFDGRDGRPSVPPQKDMMDLLELVGLGTVADVMVLTGLNRAYVTRGIEICNKHVNPGLNALRLLTKKDPREAVTAKDFGWVFGPRVNAAGRIADAMLGVDLLTTDDPEEAERLAKQLDEMNAKRKAIEEKVTEPAIEQFKDRVPGVDRKVAIAVVEDAHEGVVGISAGRLKEAYDCPAIVLARDHHGNYKGSARSVKGFSIGHGIISAKAAGLVIGGGGHDMAGGVTLEPGQLTAFEAHLNAEIEASDYFRDGVSTEVDVFLQPEQLTVELIDAFNEMEPFGNGNLAPRVVLEGAVINEIKVLKEKHFKVVVQAGKRSLDCMIWGCVGTVMGTFLQDSIGHKVDFYGTPDINVFRGNRSAQMIIDDVREHAASLL